MNILVLGHSPGPMKCSSKVKTTKHRVSDWLKDYDYDFHNLSPVHAPVLRLSEVKDEHVLPAIKHDKIIALGNLASQYLTRKNIDHLKVPHPSMKNRVWNDSSLEPKVIKQIREYIGSV
tara:strand:+ start:83 stop:439 length:357 start_codon:yes stop_codon:yes gene_type:complete